MKRLLGALAALLLMAGCVTAPATTEPAELDTWRGLYVNEIIPPLEMVALGNRANQQGRVTIQTVPYEVVARMCAATGESGVTQACTVKRGNAYTIYVDQQYPYWFRELLGTHEFGHVGQYEAGLPTAHSENDGYVDPTLDLIRRLGG